MQNHFDPNEYQLLKEMHLSNVWELARQHEVYCKVHYPTVTAAAIQTLLHGHVLDDAITVPVITGEQVKLLGLDVKEEVQQTH